MKSYTGKTNKVYQLEDTPIGQGGEGAVYAISNDPDRVAKLYHEHKKFRTEDERKELLEKIETMYSMKIKTKIDGILRVAWVEDILFDNGTFVGYVMPRVTVPYKIFHVTRDDRIKIFPNYTWKYSVQYAYNLSWVVWYLHMNDIIIGDMNMNNIAVGSKGEVVLIDCDSFDIRDKRTGKHHKCTVGLQELLAPELQMAGKLADATFTKESDNFSLAIHIFRLLMNNADPFGAKVLGQNTDSKAVVSANHAIINGECPHFRSVQFALALLVGSCRVLYSFRGDWCETFWCEHTETTVCLTFAPLQFVGRALAQEWALGAPVWLFRWQLNLGEYVSWHFISYYSAVLIYCAVKLRC